MGEPAVYLILSDEILKPDIHLLRQRKLFLFHVEVSYLR